MQRTQRGACSARALRLGWPSKAEVTLANEGLWTSSNGIAFIIRSEALIDGIYNDYRGYATFGVGHLLYKHGSFLLAAAKESADFKAQILKSHGVKYLPCSAPFQDGFDDLTDAALTKAQVAVGAKAQSSVDLEVEYLSRTPADVLQEDLVSREQTVRRSVKVQLAQCEFDALISFQFNTGGLVRSGLLTSVNKAMYRAFTALPANPTIEQRKAAIADIRAQFAKWSKSAGKFDPGLLKRRNDEADLFLVEANGQLEYFMTGRSPAMLGPQWRPPLL